MNKLNKSLQSKLSTGILLMAIPVFLLSLGILFAQSRDFIRQEANEHASSLLSSAMHRVKKYLLATETATNASVWLIEQNFHPDSLLAVSRRVVTLNRNIHGCSISAEPDMFPQYGRYFSVYTVDKGDTIVSTREPDYDYFSRLWYKTPIAKGEGCWVDPIFEHSEGRASVNETVVAYCKPLFDRSAGTDANGRKRIVGVICTELAFSILAEAINSTEPDYPNSYFIMLGGNGRYCIHPDSTRLFKKTIFTDLNPEEDANIVALGHEMTTGKQGNMHVKIQGRLCHVSYMPIPSTDWSIALISPDNEILKSYNQLANIITALIVVGLAVILWLCRKVVGHAVQPLNYLLNMSQQISGGHYDVEIPQTEREDAIGQLQNSFAAMQQSIEDHLSNIRQTAEETKQRNEELASAMKLAEEGVRQKSLFIQNVSHQIRTPLNIVQGFAEVLQDSQDMPEKELQEIRGLMEYNAKHLNRMVLMLFDSSDTGLSESWKSQRSDLASCNELANECVIYIQGHFPGLSIRFETEVPDDLQIQTNHLYLMRSLRELLYNAAKYSDGQHIVLRVSQTEASVRFTVEDVGAGLSEEALEKLFKPFSKVDDLSEGLGLGLSLARRYIIMLGGILELDTTYHDGCRFFAIMPK